MAEALASPTLEAPPAAPAPLAPDAIQLRPNAELDQSFADLNEFATDSATAEKPADQQPPAPVRGPDGKFAPREKPAEIEPDEPPKPPEKKPEAAKPPEKPAEPKPGEAPKAPVTAPELRKAYENLKNEHATLKKEHETLKTAKPPEDVEKKQMAVKLQAAEKRLSELDETLRFTNYERSPEYKEKYEKPYIQAYQLGRKRISTLDVVERATENPDTGERKIEQQARPATPEDFDVLVSITDDREARKMAKQMFGEDAGIALAHREKVHEASQAASAAVEDYRKNGAEREKQQQEMTAKQRAEVQQEWERLNKATVEKYPKLFGPIEGDKEGNELLEKGFAMVDRAFSTDANKLSPLELAKLHTQIRNRAAGFGRQVMINKRQAAQIKELEAKLKEIEESVPGGGDGAPIKPAGEAKFGEDALDGYSHRA